MVAKNEKTDREEARRRLRVRRARDLARIEALLSGTLLTSEVLVEPVGGESPAGAARVTEGARGLTPPGAFPAYDPD